MTFKELVDAYTFDDIAPSLSKIVQGHEDGNFPAFKTAYDNLRRKEAISHPDKIIVSLEGYEDEERYVGVRGMHRASWSECLGMEIVLEDVELTNHEIAAHCLWELTFFGSKEDSFFKKCCEKKTVFQTEEECKADEIEWKIFEFEYPTSAKSELNKRDEFRYSVDVNEKARTRMNRSKRKRLYRWEKRCKQLKSIGKIKIAISALTASSDIEPNELDYLFATKEIYKFDYQSYADHLEERASYLVELFTKYARRNFKQFTRYCFLFQSAPQYPITEKEKLELEKIKTVLNDDENAEVRFGYGTDETLDDQISVLSLMSF